jgi:hypothetical protein
MMRRNRPFMKAHSVKTILSKGSLEPIPNNGCGSIRDGSDSIRIYTPVNWPDDSVAKRKEGCPRHGHPDPQPMGK